MVDVSHRPIKLSPYTHYEKMLGGRDELDHDNRHHVWQDMPYMIWKSDAPIARAPSTKLVRASESTCIRMIRMPYTLPRIPIRRLTSMTPGEKKVVRTISRGNIGIGMKISIARHTISSTNPP